MIDGGVQISSELFLLNPLLLPGEKNFPLPDGTIGSSGTTSDGNATITDLDATHVSAQTGERPGFDPRMNDFSFTTTFLNGTAEGTTLDVASVSRDILSVAKGTAFTVDYSLQHGGVTVPGAAVFTGTPDQSSLRSISWAQADVKLNGLPNVGETWTLSARRRRLLVHGHGGRRRGLAGRASSSRRSPAAPPTSSRRGSACSATRA